MKCYKLFIFCLIFFAVSSFYLYAQESPYPKDSPEWLVDMFFNKPQFPEKEKYYSGEMLQDVKYPTIGEELKSSDSNSFRKIAENNQSEVYSVIIKNNGNSSSFYCYLLRVSGNWKIDAIRKFQFPKFIYNAADSLAKVEDAPDSVLNLQRMLELMVSTDEQLKTFLSDDINSFYTLINDFENNQTGRLELLMNKIGLESIFYDDLYPGCIFILVGRVDRLEVGYIYLSNRSGLPSITPKRFIYIEEVLPKWFVYRAM
ncbi:MAG: hypothetical protein O6940_09045 [Ignavibacteria bacterium]|nr:hypothetical protein [Ignavibacteria bacterium]